MKLLVVEDDLKIAAAVKRGLEAEGFTVDVAADGDDGWWMATESSYDLVVLDIMLPRRNGYVLCGDLRAAGDWTPILMLTAKEGDLDEAEALETGADDFLSKPFSFPVLIALATIVVLVVLVAAGAVLVVLQRAALLDQLDDSLQAEVAQAAAALGAGGEVPTSDDRVMWVVPGGTAPGGAGLSRVWSAPFEDPAGTAGVVRIAAPLDDVDEAVSELIVSLAWIIPVAAVALAAVVWFVVGRTLRPVERIRGRVAAIGITELDQRVPVPPGDDEIARLAVTMNEMLARLEQSARRQQQFVADAAHELRTPLTRMRTELDVDARHPEVADPAASRASQLEEIVAMQRMIDDLLLLARSDAGGVRRSELIDLDDVVLEELRAIPARPPTVDGRGVSAAQVVGDRDELRRVVRNLVDNARRHATTAITVALAEGDGRATLSITDDGAGIPADRRDEVFERFTRLDAARSTATGRAGLGLAIVHDIVARHGGAITVEDGPAGGARFVVELPTA